MGFLAVSVLGDDARVRAAADRLGFDVRQAVTTGNLLDALGVDEVPSTVLVSADGRILGVARAERSEAFFRRRARGLLARD